MLLCAQSGHVSTTPREPTGKRKQSATEPIAAGRVHYRGAHDSDHDHRRASPPSSCDASGATPSARGCRGDSCTQPCKNMVTELLQFRGRSAAPAIGAAGLPLMRPIRDSISTSDEVSPRRRCGVQRPQDRLPNLLLRRLITREVYHAGRLVRSWRCGSPSPTTLGGRTCLRSTSPAVAKVESPEV